MPKVSVSVLMAFYNEIPQRLKRSIDSLVGQTFQDWELIIVDDASTNDAKNILLGYRDARIKLINNEQNRGLTKSLNLAAQSAKGKYLARLDSDDYCLPERLAKQWEFMQANGDYVVCGTRYQEEYESKLWPQSVQFLEHHEALKNALSCFNPLAHSTLFFRQEAFSIVGGFDERVVYAQDFDLLVRFSKIGKLKNLNEVLVVRNMDADRISVRKAKKQLISALRSRARAMLSHGITLKAIVSWLRSLVVLMLPSAVLRCLRGVGTKQFLKL